MAQALRVFVFYDDGMFVSVHNRGMKRVIYVELKIVPERHVVSVRESIELQYGKCLNISNPIETWRYFTVLGCLQLLTRFIVRGNHFNLSCNWSIIGNLSTERKFDGKYYISYVIGLFYILHEFRVKSEAIVKFRVFQYYTIDPRPLPN